jgi:ABC-type transporter Mla MlaB component
LHVSTPSRKGVKLGMLKITVHEGAKGQTIQLEGKIVGPWVEELSRAWHTLTPSHGSRKLHLDLRGVTFVDTKGRQLLQDIHQKTNASFLADSPLTQYFAEDAMRRSPKGGEEGV